MDFEIISGVEEVETITTGRNIRNLAYLQKVCGRGRWRKLKGKAYVGLQNGELR